MGWGRIGVGGDGPSILAEEMNSATKVCTNSPSRRISPTVGSARSFFACVGGIHSMDKSMRNWIGAGAGGSAVSRW